VIVVFYVASMAQTLKVVPVIPTVWRIPPLHDVVHLLGGEAASVARRVPHQPDAAHPLPA
jgi:hypothetical protein